jgi:hypothetical protein
MTAAPKYRPDGSSCRSIACRRPAPKPGKANVLGEATGACTLGAAGVGVQTHREGLAETKSGRACAQQGLAATCKDHPCEAMPKPGGGQQVWRMSPYERRRGGNALPGGSSCLPRGGNADARQRGSGHLAVPGGLSDTEPRQSHPRSGDELMSKPASRRVYVGQYLSHAALGRLTKESQGQNRIGEIPPSGIVGGLAGTWTRWEPD